MDRTSTIKGDFFIEKTTNSSIKRLIINQCSDSLEIFIQENDHRIIHVEKHLIMGLPKKGKIPKKFFDSCYCTISNSKHIRFNLRIIGGGNGVSRINQSITGLKPEIDQLTIEIERLKNKMFSLNHEIESKKYNLRLVIKEIQNSILKITEYSDEYTKFVISFKELDFNVLNTQLESCHNKESFILNIQNRIFLISKKREELTLLKCNISKIEIELTKIKNFILHKKDLGKEIQKELNYLFCESKHTFHIANDLLEKREELCKMADIIATPITFPLLLIIPNYSFRLDLNSDDHFSFPSENIPEIRLWIEKTEIILNKIEEEIEKINERIIYNDKITCFLDKLIYKMKTNESALILRDVKKIGYEELKKILENNEQLSLYESSMVNTIDF